MTGCLCRQKTSAGKEYYYVKLNYIDPKTGKRSQKKVKTGLEVKKGNKRKAEQRKQELLVEYRYLEDALPEEDMAFSPDTPFVDYLSHWLEGKRRDLKKSTFEGYEIRIRRMQEYFRPKEYRLKDIDAKIVDSFYRNFLTSGKLNQKTGEREPLSVRSVRSYKSLLFAVFAQAMIEGLVRSNPTVGVAVHGKKNSVYSEEMLFLTEEEISEMLEFLAKRYPRLVGIAFFGAFYGLRRSEIVGLQWKAVDFKKKLIHIQHTVVRLKTIDESDNTKTPESRRSLDLFPTAEECLKQIRAEQEGYREFYGKEYQNRDGYVFTWEDGRRYAPDYLTKTFKKAMIDFGRPEISLHKLRHSCASMLFDRDWDVKKMQYWLGHRDTQTTMNIYTHFNKQRMNTASEQLEEIAGRNSGLFRGGKEAEGER